MLKTASRLLLTTASTLLIATLASAQVPPQSQVAQQKSIPLPEPPAPNPSQIPSDAGIAWAQKTLAGWPERTRRLGALLFTKYGAPVEITARQVTWLNNGPWKRTTLYKEEIQHNFAAPHKNVLEQVINYNVPIDKLAELAQFNSALVANRVRGELSSTSDAEDINFLALNVADDIVKGERDVDQARTYYAQIVRAKMIREPEHYLQKLKFTPAKTGAEASDPGEIAPLIKHMSGGDAQ